MTLLWCLHLLPFQHKKTNFIYAWKLTVRSPREEHCLHQWSKEPWHDSLLLSDMMAIGCDLNGVHYENGEAFQPSPLYKCTCIAGAIGCIPAFIEKPAGLLGPASLMGNMPAGLRGAQSPKKNQQDTTYMSGVFIEKTCGEGPAYSFFLTNMTLK